MTPETFEKKAIKDYLAVKNIYNFPIMQGLGAFPGLPDRMAIKDGKVYAIEVKCKKGKQSEKQKVFQDEWTKNGGIYVLGGIDDVMEVL